MVIFSQSNSMRFKQYLIKIFGLVLLLSSTGVQADRETELTRGQQVIRQQWQDVQTTLQQEQQERTLKTLKSRTPEVTEQNQIPQTTKSQQPLYVRRKTTCLPLQKMDVKGLAILSEKRQKAIYKMIPQECISAADLNELSRFITSQFLESGFFSIHIKQDKSATQNLVWTVYSARVTEIRNKTTLRTENLYPDIEGKPVNIQDLDQGLDQANRLKSHKVTMDIFPNKEGDMAIELVDQPKRPVYGSFSWNNRGQDNLGRGKVQASVGIDNIAGLADSLSIYGGTTTTREKDHYSRNAGLYYSIPYGYWTFSVFGGASAYSTELRLPSGFKAKQNGSSWQVGTRLNRVVSRGQRHITSLYGQLKKASVTNKFMDSKLDISSYDLATLSLGTDYALLLNNGDLAINAEYSQGLSMLGADKDIAGSKLPKMQFKKLSGSVSWRHNRVFAGRAVRFSHKLFLQKGFDRLPAIEGIGITDTISGVRGFRNTSLSGDTGAYLRQSVSSTWQAKDTFITPYLGLDIGRAKYNDETWKSATGATVGVYFTQTEWFIHLYLTKGWLHSNSDLDDDSIDTEFWAEASWMF